MNHPQYGRPAQHGQTWRPQDPYGHQAKAD